MVENVTAWSTSPPDGDREYQTKLLERRGKEGRSLERTPQKKGSSDWSWKACTSMTEGCLCWAAKRQRNAGELVSHGVANTRTVVTWPSVKRNPGARQNRSRRWK